VSLFNVIEINTQVSHSFCLSKVLNSKGSAKNKFAISGVEALGWQGAKKHEYQAYSEFSQRSQAGCIGA